MAAMGDAHGYDVAAPSALMQLRRARFSVLSSEAGGKKLLPELRR